MKHIRTIYEQDINPEAIKIETDAFRRREAVRAVVFDHDGKVALLYVGMHNYHKLPGGGIDDGEGIIEALERELQEEIGCTAQIVSEVGKIIEYRDEWRFEQTSYCFIANQIGEKFEPDFTEEERAEGFEIVWTESLDQAITYIKQDKPSNYEGMFIKQRDLAFVREARAQLVG